MEINDLVLAVATKISELTERAVRAETERDHALASLENSEHSLKTIKAELDEAKDKNETNTKTISYQFDARCKLEKRISELEAEIARLKGEAENA